MPVSTNRESDKSIIQDTPLAPREFFTAKIFTAKAIAVLAMLLAIRSILNLPFLTIHIGPDFKLITFVYLTDALAAMLFGPIAGIAFGFAGDFLGYIASNGAGGAYFPGFAISEMITCFIFACFFFRRSIKLSRVIIAWILNLILVLLGLNSLWLTMMYGMNAGEVFTFARVLNNAIQTPVHITILYFLLQRIRRLTHNRL